MAGDGDNCVVRLRPPCSRVDDDKNSGVVLQAKRLKRHRDGDVGLAENLLQTVKREACELRLYQVWPVLHHDFELAMSLFTLPHRDKVQHMHTLSLLALLFASITAKLYAPDGEEWTLGGGIHHLNESGVEVDLRRQRGNRDQTGTAYGEDGSNSLIEKALIAVGGFLQDEYVPARALGGPNLHKHRSECLVSNIEKLLKIKSHSEILDSCFKQKCKNIYFLRPSTWRGRIMCPVYKAYPLMLVSMLTHPVALPPLTSSRSLLRRTDLRPHNVIFTRHKHSLYISKKSKCTVHDIFFCPVCQEDEYIRRRVMKVVVGALKRLRVSKTMSVLTYLGADSWQQVTAYLAAKRQEWNEFYPGIPMTVTNTALDHIRPVSMFKNNSFGEKVMLCNHLTNLQPLLHEDNTWKGDFWSTEDEIYWHEHIIFKSTKTSIYYPRTAPHQPSLLHRKQKDDLLTSKEQSSVNDTDSDFTL